MKEKIQTIVRKSFALLVIIFITVVICAMFAGPFMLGWNVTFGLFLFKVTFMNCLYFILSLVLGIALISATLDKLAGEDNDG